MKTYHGISDHDLLARVLVISPEFGGRKVPIYDGYKGQFFWHINKVNNTDWDAIYYFEGGSAVAETQSMCKIYISENLKKYSNGKIPVGHPFGIREGTQIVAVGIVVENNLNSA